MLNRNDDVKVYQDKRTKAEDYKSSAYTLLIVGIIGLIVLFLMITGVLPFRLYGSGKYITYGVLGVMFVVFIVMGISSFRSAKMYAKEATDEADLTKQIKAWAKEQITADRIKERVWFEDGMPDEVKYFQYFETIKTIVTQEFGALNVSYLESLCEELYTDIFEEK